MMTANAPRRLCSFLAHTEGTTSASFSPDGQLLATGGYDCAVRLWDTDTWQEVRALPGHRRGHVAFSPDGATLVSGGLHRNATVYDVGAWQSRRTLRDTGGTWDLVFDPARPRLTITQPFSWGDVTEQPIELRDTRTWRRAGRAGVGAVYVHAVAFHPDGERVAVAVGEQVGVWSADFARHLADFTAHDSATWGLAFSPDGTTLATGGADNVTRLWDTVNWEARHVLENEAMAADAGHRNAILCAAFSPEGETLVTGGLDGVTTVWRLG